MVGRPRLFNLVVVLLLTSMLIGFGVAGAFWYTRTPPAQTSAENDKALGESDATLDEVEQFNSVAEGQLKQIAKLLTHPELITEESVKEFSLPGVWTTALRPQELHEVFHDAAFRVRRPADSNDPSRQYEGTAGLARSLQELAAPFLQTDEIHVKFKVYRVWLSSRSAETTVFFHASGVGKEGPLEQTSTWRCAWDRASAESKPLLSSIEALQYEEASAPSGGKLFGDATAWVLGKNASYRDQLSYGLEYWRSRIQGSLEIDVRGYHGLAVGDVNGDGLDDLFVCQPKGIPCRLYVQQRDGTTADVSASAGVDFLDGPSSALLLDIDNDGDQDLLLAVPGRVLVLKNDGGGRFSLSGTAPGPQQPGSMAAADYDQDGYLDVFVCGYGLQLKRSPSAVRHLPSPFHDAKNGEPSFLLHNDGQGNFTDGTTACGLGEDNKRYRLAVAWEDYDNDGDQDLCLANDFGRKSLYRNDGGRFVDVSAEAGVEDPGAGMSVDWADYDNDGWMDLYFGNMFSSAGGRISYQRQFRPRDQEQERAIFQRHARGNSLFRNRGGSFQDVSVEAGVTLGGWAWSSKFLDINNDSLEDIYVVNGFITNDNPDDL